MGSLRSMGYSFESAVADVVDNSISAHAQNIRILFPSNPMDELALGILDDGDGMAADVLFEAMRYGCLSAEEERAEEDLGRFGMGMKSASLSQCRCLTVVSYEGKTLNGYTWDYNHILEVGFHALHLFPDTDGIFLISDHFSEIRRQRQSQFLNGAVFLLLRQSIEILQAVQEKVGADLNL